MCFSVRKSKVQHVDNICPLIISAQHFLLKQFVSHSLFKATPLFEGSGEIRFFLEFHLLCTWVNESHLPSGEMSGNLPHFLFVKGQHLFPKSTAWRCPFTYACTYCWMLDCSEPQWWFPSNRTLSSVGFRFSQVIFCFWTLCWAAFTCRLSPNTSLRLSQNFRQRSPSLLWLQ